MSDMPTGIDEWTDLAKILLSPERLGIALDEAPAEPAPGDVGAVFALGRVATDCDVRVAAYIFDEWAGGSEAIEALRARVETEGRTHMAIVNGCILVFATAGPAIDDQVALLNVSSRLSGAPRGS